MSAAPVEEFEVGDAGDLDAAGVLAAAAEAEQAERRAALRKLELAYQWAILHPASDETGVETPGGPALDVLVAAESLGGDGTPAVAAFTPEAFAAALGMTPSAGAQLIGDALDLRHRLPLLWRRVVTLQVPAWRARRVAQQTHRLPLAGARWVDEQLGARTGCGPVVVDRLVAEAVARFDPEAHQQREDDAQASWDLNLFHPEPGEFAGTSDLHAQGDTLTLDQFHDLVCAIANRLHLDGDPDPLGVRKIKAIGLITALVTALVTGLVTGQAALDLTAVLGAATGPKRSGKIKVHVHVDADDLDLDAEAGPALATGTVEKIGPATLARIRSWVGHHQVVILPVLNMHRGDAVDVHDPPDWMRELVILRDRHCVFPGCQVDARNCDLDHNIPYDENGPPGQTHPDNLACLCRRHHRAKTAGVWRYTRTPAGHYPWTGPHGTRYLVTPVGTFTV
jgi:hypothetical protein